MIALVPVLFLQFFIFVYRRCAQSMYSDAALSRSSDPKCWEMKAAL